MSQFSLHQFEQAGYRGQLIHQQQFFRPRHHLKKLSSDVCFGQSGPDQHRCDSSLKLLLLTNHTPAFSIKISFFQIFLNQGNFMTFLIQFGQNLLNSSLLHCEILKLIADLLSERSSRQCPKGIFGIPYFYSERLAELSLNCSAFTSSFCSGTSSGVSAGVSFGASVSDILKVQTIVCPFYDMVFSIFGRT